MEYYAAIKINVLYVKVWMNLTNTVLNEDKEATHKRLHIVWLHSQNVERQVKHSYAVRS